MILIGFFQGVHTAVRWFTQTDTKIDKIILCSSDFPKDADFTALKKKLNENVRLYYIYGLLDMIFTKDTYQASMNLLKLHKIDFTDLDFDGGHVINEKIIQKILLK